MSTKESPLRPAKEKIKRAQEKFRNLKSSINAFIESNPHSVSWQVQGQTVYIVSRLNKDLPPNVVWELVEAISHLRGALDKLVSALAEANGRGTSGVGFPFGGIGNNGKPNPFPDSGIENRVKKKLTPDQWALIEAQKPYPGGNETLWAINVIANIDKHDNLLVEVAPFIDHSAVIRRLSGVFQITSNPIEHDLVLADKEREKVLFTMTPTEGANPQYDIACQITESVVFGPIVPVHGKNILTTLNEQIRLVEGILDIFGRTFFR